MNRRYNQRDLDCLSTWWLLCSTRWKSHAYLFECTWHVGTITTKSRFRENTWTTSEICLELRRRLIGFGIRLWLLVCLMLERVHCVECLPIGRHVLVEHQYWLISMSDKIKYRFPELLVRENLQVDLKAFCYSSGHGDSSTRFSRRRFSYWNALSIPLWLQNSRWKYRFIQWNCYIHSNICKYSIGKRREM